MAQKSLAILRLEQLANKKGKEFFSFNIIILNLGNYFELI